MIEYLFSYGTLQKDTVQLDLYGRLLNGKKDILQGFRIEIVEIKDAVFLAKGNDKFQQTLRRSNDTDFVDGTAFELTDAELIRTDDYEPENYRRVKVKLNSGLEAWVYLAE